MTWRYDIGGQLAVRTVAVMVKANRYGLSGRFGYGVESVRPGSESPYRLTRGLPVTWRNVTFSGGKGPPWEPLRYHRGSSDPRGLIRRWVEQQHARVICAGRKLWVVGFFNGFSMFSIKTNCALTFWKCARGGPFRLWVIFAKVLRVKEGFQRFFQCNWWFEEQVGL